MVRKFIKSNKPLLIKFLLSFFVCILLSFVIFSISANALPIAGNENLDEDAPTDPSVLEELIGVDANQQLEVVLLITIISLAPSILIMMTSFTRIIIVFSFLRNAMATQQTPPNQVLTGLALFLTFFIMAPVFKEINDTAYKPYTDGTLTTMEAVEQGSIPLKKFMLKQTATEDLNFFIDLSNKRLDRDEITSEILPENLGLEIIIPSFVISELKRAFLMGFILFIPFLIIDIVIASTLMSMGMMMLPPAMISMPFKVMIFVLVDGWQLLVGTLISSYN